MKKVVILVIVLSFSFQFTSCKSDEKKENITVKKEAKYALKNAENNIEWTAYKTTDKIGVNGKFNTVNIINNGEGNTINEAINGTEFSIPVSSIFTKDKNRDFKIQKFFFGIMDNTSLLNGRLTLEDNTKGIAEITMNGKTEKMPFTYTIEGEKFTLSAVMNLEKWDGTKALTSLNNACKDLHSGADGVTKTWNEVAINITSIFK